MDNFFYVIFIMRDLIQCGLFAMLLRFFLFRPGVRQKIFDNNTYTIQWIHIVSIGVKSDCHFASIFVIEK